MASKEIVDALYERGKELVRQYGIHDAMLYKQDDCVLINVPRKMYFRTYNAIRRKRCVRNARISYCFGDFQTTFTLAMPSAY